MMQDSVLEFKLVLLECRELIKWMASRISETIIIFKKKWNKGLFYILVKDTKKQNQ